MDLSPWDLRGYHAGAGDAAIPRRFDPKQARVKSGDNEPAELDSGSDYCTLSSARSRGESERGAVMTEIRHRDLSQVERGVETALRNFTSNGANGGGEMPEITAAERIEKIGNISALAIIEASETTAKDIESAAQAAVDIAADILKEEHARQGVEPVRDTARKLKT